MNKKKLKKESHVRIRFPGSTPALFMRIKSAFWYSKCALNAHKKRWCATWVRDFSFWKQKTHAESQEKRTYLSSNSSIRKRQKSQNS